MPPAADRGEAQADKGLEVQEVAPSTDRGVTVTWSGIHWLTGTCQGDPEAIKDIVCRHLFGLPLEDRETGIWRYQSRAVESVTKAFVAWGGKNGNVAVNLPGEACEMLGFAGIVELAAELDLKITRLDLAWDTELMTPQQVMAQHLAGNAVTHAKKTKWMEERGGKASGATFYIGARGGTNNGRLVRFYDRRGPTRVELEVHEKRADMLWAMLTKFEAEEWSKLALAYLVDFVDFRDRAADMNVKRCPRLSWWEDFVQGASRLALPLPRKAPDLEKQKAWMQHGVAATLATVADAHPDPTKYVLDLLKGGRGRRSPRQAALLDVTLSIQAALSTA